MVEFAKSRGFLGYGVWPGGQNDKDSSHAVLPLAEYDELLRRIAVAERDKHEAIEQAKRTIGRERAAAEQRVREAEEAAQEQVTAMEEKLTRAEKEVNYQKGLNANLLRISRERANADRSLRFPVFHQNISCFFYIVYTFFALRVVKADDHVSLPCTVHALHNQIKGCHQIT